MLLCTRPPSAPWKGQKSKLVHDLCDVLLWGAHGPFMMAAGLGRDKRGSMWEQGPRRWVSGSPELFSAFKVGHCF